MDYNEILEQYDDGPVKDALKSYLAEAQENESDGVFLMTAGALLLADTIQRGNSREGIREAIKYALLSDKSLETAKDESVKWSVEELKDFADIFMKALMVGADDVDKLSMYGCKVLPYAIEMGLDPVGAAHELKGSGVKALQMLGYSGIAFIGKKDCQE